MKVGQYTSYKSSWCHRLLLIGVPVAVLVVVGFFVWRIAYGPIPFDRARWDARSSDWQDTTRHRMADGLIESRKLIGLSREEIVALLGDPSQAPYFQPQWNMEYVLGVERGFFIRIDSEHLVIRLGSDGRANAAGLAHD